MPLPIRRTALATTLALGALAAPAAAHTYCVGLEQCPDEGSKTISVQHALDAAAASAGADTVRVGPGDYTGPFSYAADPAAGGPVVLRGAGRGRTRLFTPPAVGTPALVLGAAGSEVRDLAIESPDRPALSLNRIALVEDVDLGGSAGIVASTGTLDDVRSVVRRTRIRASATGVTSGLGGVAIEDSLIEITGTGAGTQAVDASTQFIPVAIEARHLTLVGHGGASVGVRVSAWKAAASVVLRDSVLTGFGHDTERTGAEAAAALTARWSRLDAAGDVDAGKGATTLEHLTVAAPGLAADFTLAPGSPLIDAGDPEGSAGGVDLAGRPRVVAGSPGAAARRDLGAYEAATRTPAPPVADRPAAPEPAPALTLTLRGRKRQHGRRVVVRAVASEAATLAARGTLAARRTRKVEAAAAAGAPVKLAIRLPRSARRERVVGVKVRAVAPDGRTATAVRKVRVLRAAR